MFEVIGAPSSRFAKLKEKPQWVMPFVLALVVPLVVSVLALTLFPRPKMIEAVEQRMERVRSFVEQRLEQSGMSSEQKAETLKRIDDQTRTEVDRLKTQGLFGMFGRYLLQSLFAVVWSGIVLLLFTVIVNFLLPVLGAGTAFKRMFAVTSHAALVRIVGSLARGAVMLATGNLTVHTGLGLVSSGIRSPFLKGVLSGIDIFTVWELALVALGLKVMFGVQAKRAAFAVFGVWLVYLLVGASWFSMFGGLVGT